MATLVTKLLCSLYTEIDAPTLKYLVNLNSILHWTMQLRPEKKL